LKAQRDYFLKRWLTRFLLDDDPIKSMLKWMLTELMKAEAEAKLGAPKGMNSRDRKHHISSTNGLERTNSKLRRKNRVVGVFS
jgi:transposase-like protein